MANLLRNPQVFPSCRFTALSLATAQLSTKGLVVVCAGSLQSSKYTAGRLRSQTVGVAPSYLICEYSNVCPLHPRKTHLLRLKFACLHGSHSH